MGSKLTFFKSPKFFLPFLAFGLLIVFVFITVRNMSEPAEGNIQQIPLAQAEKVEPFAQPGSFKGKYISFKFPAHYKRIPATLSGSYLEVDSYHSTDTTGRQINIGVAKGSIASDAGVSFRRQHKELYKENTSNIGLEFSKLDGTEDSFFIEHNDMLATISATAPYDNQAGDALFVASGLKWL